MIISWAAEKAQQFLPEQDAEFGELCFDFALSAEVMDLLYAQNDGCMGAVAEASQQAETAGAADTNSVALDEHELALA